MNNILDYAIDILCWGFGIYVVFAHYHGLKCEAPDRLKTVFVVGIGVASGFALDYFLYGSIGKTIALPYGIAATLGWFFGKMLFSIYRDSLQNRRYAESRSVDINNPEKFGVKEYEEQLEGIASCASGFVSGILCVIVWAFSNY